MPKKKATKTGKASKQGTKPPISKNAQRLFATTEIFCQDLKCARELFNIVVPTLKTLDDNRGKNIEKTMARLDMIRKKKVKAPDAHELPKIIMSIRQLRGDLKKLDRANRMFRCNSLVLLISKYDEYLSDVLRVILEAHPDQLKSSDKMLSYEDIAGAGKLSDVFDKFVSKEIEKVIRMSHEEQLNYLDSKLKLKLKENYTSWSDFVEMTERRNLFVHCGGEVNSQYLKVCREHGIKLDKKIKEGVCLLVSKEYFEKAYRAVYELGVRIGQGVFRQLFPESLYYIDRSLSNELGVTLEEDNQWELALTVFNFALSIPQKYI